ncbi:hypothetical protein ACFSJY_03765 [Thalassotalea euphylliae]|uniref:hypothetical protein n=1 Tax=Thalassotalea euphylliae TaxID=1655234 RepID=UPI00362BC50E
MTKQLTETKVLNAVAVINQAAADGFELWRDLKEFDGYEQDLFSLAVRNRKTGTVRKPSADGFVKLRHNDGTFKRIAAVRTKPLAL